MYFISVDKSRIFYFDIAALYFLNGHWKITSQTFFIGAYLRRSFLRTGFKATHPVVWFSTSAMLEQCGVTADDT